MCGAPIERALHDQSNMLLLIVPCHVNRSRMIPPPSFQVIMCGITYGIAMILCGHTVLCSNIAASNEPSYDVLYRRV